MRRLYLFLAALLLLWVATPTVRAAWVVSENVTPASQVTAGKLYVLETASSTYALGHYLQQDESLNQLNQPEVVDSLCIWELITAPETNPYTGETQYYIRNFKTGQYMKKLIMVSEENALAYVIHSVNDQVSFSGGTLDFRCVRTDGDGDPEKGWDDNASTIAITEYNKDDQKVHVSFLANWYNWGGINFWEYKNTNPWNFREVENDSNVRADLKAIIDEYSTNGYDTYFYSSDTNPFAIYTSVVDAMKEAYALALETYGNTEASDEDVVAAQIALQNAIRACKDSKNMVPLTSGYYYIKTAYSGFTSSPTTENIAWCALDNYPNMIRWQAIESDNKTPYLWKVTVNEDGNAQMQNMYTGQFVDGQPLDKSSDYYLMVNGNARNQTVVSKGRGQVGIRPEGVTDSYQFAHLNGAGTSGTIMTWESSLGNGSVWYFEAETDEEFIKQAENDLVQRALDNKLSTLISTSESLLKSATAESLTHSAPLVVLGSQFSSNNPEANEGMTESQMYENLIDGKTSTYYHSAWTSTSDVDDAYHYLQVKASGNLPTSLKMYWYRRTQNSNNRPTNVGISVSADGETWTTVIDSLKGLPTSDDTPYYLSPEITIPEGNSYFRVTVYETNNGVKSPTYNHPFFTFSEFNLYERASYGLDPSTSQGARPEVAAQVAVLQAAVDAAKAVVSGTTTQNDIDALQTALDAFYNVWADSTELLENIEEAGLLLENAVSGEEIGNFPQESIDALQAAYDAAVAARPLYAKTKAEVDAMAETLAKAIDAYTVTMVVPEENKWYYIVSNVSASVRVEDGDIPQPTRDQVMYASEYCHDGAINWGGKAADNVTNARAVWKFIKQDDGTYAIQNMGCGWYMGQGGKSGTTVLLSDTIVKYRFVPLTGNAADEEEESASGQIGLQCVVNPILLHAQWSGKHVVNLNTTPAGNSASSWRFEEITAEEQQEVASFIQNRYYVVTVPYVTTGVPYAPDGTDISFYTLTGATRGENGAISEIKFSSYYGESLTPGTPYLMKVGEKADGSEDDEVLVDMQIDTEELNLTLEPARVNGLQGLLTDIVLKTSGFGYFGRGEEIIATEEEDYVYIAAQRGYIVANDIQDIEGATNDLVLKVDGDGLVNKIKGTVVAENETVDVYTIDGVLVKKNVKAASAAQGLQKGVYIIGNKKAIVK